MKSVGVSILFGLLVACSSTTPSTTRRLSLRNPTALASNDSRDDRRRCDASGAGRSSSEYDTNADGVPDVRKVFQVVGEGQDAHPVLVCREVDLNHDGTKDVFRFYNDQGRTLREEEDRDFDGRLDVITYFDNGEVVRREFDINHDGMIDQRLYYRENRPYRAEREMQSDNAADFRPDYWEFYDTRGHVVRIGTDYDHDGRADRWDRVDRIAPLRTPVAAAQAGAQSPPSANPPASGTSANTPPAPTDATSTPTNAPAVPAGATPAPAGVTPPNP
jgi:hypothetical protein